MFNTDYRDDKPFEYRSNQIGCIVVTMIMLILSIIFGSSMLHLMHEVNEKMSVVAHNTYLMCNTTKALNPMEYNSYCISYT